MTILESAFSLTGYPPLWWCGLILATFSGWALSSYASNFTYRLPRNEKPLGKKPYCGECDTLLQPKDLAPILSFLWTDGKCRYCGAAIPISYYILELLYPLLFIAAYVHFGFGDLFLLIGFGSAALVALAMMAWEDGFFSKSTLVFIGVLGVCARALVFQNITEAMLGAFIGMFIAAAYSLRFKLSEKDFDLSTLPIYVWLAATLGCWLPLPTAIVTAAIWLITWFILKRIPFLQYQAVSAPVLGFVLAIIPAIFITYRL